MIRVTSYTQGKWNSKGTESDLISAVSGETIGQMLQPDLDYAAVCSYAREVAGPKIRELTIHERAFKIKFLAQYLLERKEKYYEISTNTGATRRDSWIDIEGDPSDIDSATHDMGQDDFFDSFTVESETTHRARRFTALYAYYAAQPPLST
jgi:acyl-CoA reductase-like NAD-dependent aldehyde dehydrogenase